MSNSLDSSIDANFSESFLQEFTKKIVDPYFGGDLGKALKALMDKAVLEEEFFAAHLDRRRALI